MLKSREECKPWLAVFTSSVLALVLVGCGGETPHRDSAGGDGNATEQTGSDSDTETDSSSEADTGTDNDAGTDDGGDTDSGSEPGDTGASDPDTDTGTDNSDSDTDSGSDTDVETAPVTEPEPDVNPAPGNYPEITVLAGSTATVESNYRVYLQASTADDSIAYQWFLTSGSLVELSGAPTALASFISPVVDARTEYRFTLTETSDGVTSTVTTIYVVPEAEAVTAAEGIAESGVTRGANYPTGINSDCTGETITYQDCYRAGEGLSASSRFTKLDNSGNALTAGASEWACVKDELTGLVWEIKTRDGGLRDKDSNSYQWGGGAGTDVVGSSWDELQTLLNTDQVCGFDNWRVPSRRELVGLIDYGVTRPVINEDYFPNTASKHYWTMNRGVSGRPWAVDFDTGALSQISSTSEERVRMVATPAVESGEAL